MPGEFDLIRRYFDSISGDHPSVQLGIGDDCALLSPSPHTELAISVDTLVEGVHFSTGHRSRRFGVAISCQ